LKANITKKVILLNILLTLCFINAVFPQAGTYYNSISTSSPTFITDLEGRIRSPYNRITYDNYDETMIANFASVNNGNGTRSVFCVYTGHDYIYTGTFTWGIMSREHTYCQSWMPVSSTSSDQYSDLYHLFPAHQNNANGRRSNRPLGIVQNITYQYLDGKLGTNSLGQIVYEPRDKHKGDAARALLYMSVRYDGIGGYSWDFNWLNNVKLPSLSEDPQDVNLLLAWCKQDPPDKYEIDRTNYVQSIQLNRNPFIDHPEYINYIDFNSLTKINPTYSAEPTNYVTALSSTVAGSSIQLQWNDATGAQLPSGYLIIAYSANNYFLPIDGSVYANDTILSDGSAIMNVPYVNVNNYTFANLSPNTDYYFSVFSYNGTGTLTNYKIDGTFPQTNAHVPGTLALEPTNHVTNFVNGTITSNSVQTTWNDAVPGAQVPSGYLLIANNTNSFTNPSDGTTYTDDINLTDGYAIVNISFAAANNYTFSGLYSNANYYFRLYSYNGSGTLINYKVDGTIPNTNATTSGSSNNFSSILLDNFTRANSNTLGNTISPNLLTWQESETVNPTSISLSSNRIKSASTTSGKEFAYVDAGSLANYPSVFNSSASQLVWAINLKQSRLDPSGFDASNYGVAFILGKTTTDITTGNGYAVVLGQSGSADAIRLAKFTGGTNTNAKFTNIISSGDYANQYLSIKITYNPTGNSWSLFVDSSSTAFPQTNPFNTLTQLGTASDNTYTSSSLRYLGTMWSHATGASDSAVFDDVVIPANTSTTLNLTAIVEGFYNSFINKLSLKDTVRVFLRNSIAPYEIVDSSKSVLDSITFSGVYVFNNISAGNYYIELKHRNSIETWSKLPQSVTPGVTFNYNFTDSLGKAYGDNMILHGTKYCIYSGEINDDGTIDAADLSFIDNDVSNGTEGYISTDLNGDFFVDASDASIADNNASNSVFLLRP